MKSPVFLIFFSIILLYLPTVSRGGDTVRQPVVSGTFYPRNQRELENLIGEFLGSVEKAHLQGEIYGLIVPHAGYVYSGQVAAHAYRQLQEGHYDTVVLMGPSHRGGFAGVSAADYSAYRTPLGEVKIDRALVSSLIKSKEYIGFHPEAHRTEHSLEVQLPFLQTVLTDFRIVPLLFGGQSLSRDRQPEMCRDVADTLLDLTRGRSVLFIASTDLSHYHPYDQAVIKDHDTIRGILTLRAEPFMREVQRGRFELCGAAAVATLLHIAETRGSSEARLLHYANSGDVPLIGDRSMVVGYTAVLFLH